jgi:peptidoglycan/LPS O-acetylase OafA/YrhL
LAALWVIMLHFRYGPLAEQMPLSFLFAKGFLGVPVFFILSGFILSYTYAGKASGVTWTGATLRSYLVARFARIYPVYIVILLAFPIAFLPLGIWPPLKPDTLETFFLSVFMIQSWGFTKNLVWNQSAWSVSSEFFCYLIFPGLMIILAYVPRVLSWPLLAIGSYAILTRQPEAALLSVWPSAAQDAPVLLMTLHFFWLFVLGCLVFRAFDSHCIRIGPAVSSGAIAAAFGSIVWLATMDGTDAWICLAMAALIYLIAAGSGPLRGTLGWRPFVYLGEISYSLYLIHEPAREAMYWVAKTRSLPFWLELAILIVTASVLFHAVEQPCRRLIRRWATRPGAVPVPATT